MNITMIDTSSERTGKIEHFEFMTYDDFGDFPKYMSYLWNLYKKGFKVYDSYNDELTRYLKSNKQIDIKSRMFMSVAKEAINSYWIAFDKQKSDESKKQISEWDLLLRNQTKAKN